MIVPEFWAEAKESVVIDGKSRTYKRFGWSDVSEAEAMENARERVAEAAALARQGEKVRLVDHKVSYNGAEGLPIREEIIARHGDTVITRNSYGALCLNTPDVLFADVDVDERANTTFAWVIFLLAALVGIWLRFEMNAWWPFVLFVVSGAILAPALGMRLSQLFSAGRADPFDKALARIESFAQTNTSWLLRVYRTPQGFRVLVMHSTFSPDAPEALGFMKQIESDELYVQMCRNQNCFRARVSPKPWRIGMQHIRPRPGVWPIKEERLPDRQSWVRKYDEKAADYASCKYEKTLGTGRPSRPCEAVRSVHDSMCKSESGLPIA